MANEKRQTSLAGRHQSRGDKPSDKIVAVGFLTADELIVAKQALKRVYTIPSDEGDFNSLLARIARAAEEST